MSLPECSRYWQGLMRLDELRPVYFYPAELQGHIERSYHPGE